MLDTTQIHLDYGNGKARRGFWMNTIWLKPSTKEALICFHAYTGNDYASSFFRMLESYGEASKISRSLVGSWWRRFFVHLKEFTCWPYRVKNETSVNAVRRKMFESKCSNQGKIVDLTLFPPCKPVPHLYCQKTNYVAKLWRSLESFVNSPPISQQLGK